MMSAGFAMLVARLQLSSRLPWGRKTTLLNQVLANREGRRVVVIVNMSNIDASLVAEGAAR